MILKKEQLYILELLIEHERIIGTLYNEYSQKFLRHKDFWLNLAKEETEHAQWI